MLELGVRRGNGYRFTADAYGAEREALRRRRHREDDRCLVEGEQARLVTTRRRPALGGNRGRQQDAA